MIKCKGMQLKMRLYCGLPGDGVTNRHVKCVTSPIKISLNSNKQVLNFN